MNVRCYDCLLRDIEPSSRTGTGKILLMKTFNQALLIAILSIANWKAASLRGCIKPEKPAFKGSTYR